MKVISSKTRSQVRAIAGGGYFNVNEPHELILLFDAFAATARASRRLRARSKLILTGTPIQNRVLELWAIFDFLMPNFLGTSAAFAKEYANPISKSQLPNASASMITNGLEKLKALHQQVLPFILRREKEQVLNDLPMTTLTVVRVPMSGLQSCIYRDFCSGKSVSQGLDSFGKALDGPSSGLSHLSGDVFKSLLFLRMLCTHPALVMTPSQHNSCPEIFFSMDASGKMLALAQLLREAGLAEDDITGADNDASLLYCDDDVANTDDQDSYSDVLELPDQADGSLALKGRYLNKNPTKCLIFAQFSKSLDAVEEFLFKAHMPSLGYVRLDGTVPTDKRAEVLVSFEKDPHVRVLLLTTRVGGLGLNLTAANKVIFLELDFNPYADIQAQDRCRRIGQTKQVDVYKIVTCDSIEETILFAQAKKVQVAEAVVTTENSTMFSMGTDRMLDIFSKSDSIRASNKMKFDFDLEAFVDTCARDYKFLSVDQFTEAVTSEK